MVGTVDCAVSIRARGESAGLLTFGREVYTASGMEEVQARIKKRLKYWFTVFLSVSYTETLVELELFNFGLSRFSTTKCEA